MENRCIWHSNCTIYIIKWRWIRNKVIFPLPYPLHFYVYFISHDDIPIAANTESSKVGCSEANVKETNHQVTDSKDSKNIHVLLNEQLIAAQSFKNEDQTVVVDETHAFAAKEFLQIPLTNIEWSFEAYHGFKRETYDRI